MKVYREVRIDIDTNEITYEDSFDYEGPISLAGGGPGDGPGGPGDVSNYGGGAGPGNYGGGSDSVGGDSGGGAGPGNYGGVDVGNYGGGAAGIGNYGGGVLEGPPGAPGSAGPNAAAPEPDLGGPSIGKGKADPSKNKGKGKSGLGASLGILGKSDIESEIADIADMEGGIESEGEIHGPSKEDTFLEKTAKFLDENKSNIISSLVPMIGAMNTITGFLDQDMTGNVADYGGGDPNMGGGPDDPYRDQMKTKDQMKRKEVKAKPKSSFQNPFGWGPQGFNPEDEKDEDKKDITKDLGNMIKHEIEKAQANVKSDAKKRKGYLSTFLADDLGAAPVFTPRLF